MMMQQRRYAGVQTQMLVICIDAHRFLPTLTLYTNPHSPSTSASPRRCCVSLTPAGLITTKIRLAVAASPERKKKNLKVGRGWADGLTNPDQPSVTYGEIGRRVSPTGKAGGAGGFQSLAGARATWLVSL